MAHRDLPIYHTQQFHTFLSKSRLALGSPGAKWFLGADGCRSGAVRVPFGAVSEFGVTKTFVELGIATLILSGSYM